MKQPSSTAGRGRKKASGKTSTGSRGATSQHRSGGKNSGTSGRSNGSGNRMSGSSGRSAGSGSTTSSGRSSGSNSRGSSDNRSASNSRSSSSRSNAGQGSNMRANSATTTRGRSSGQSMGAGSNRQDFEGLNYLEKFFLSQLQDIYYAERKIMEALPKMMEAATTENLTEAFEDHLHQTQRHIKRLEKVFDSLGKRPEGKKCEAIEGISREVESIIDETEEGTLTRDAALIIAAQKVEHYEIASYGGLVQLAITMDLDEAADLLDRTLVEEEDTDALLTDIAENDINLIAEHEGNEYSWDVALMYESQGGAEQEGQEQGEEEEEENETEDSRTSSVE
jgi:ferritin-like metal-binding protein YciE